MPADNVKNFCKVEVSGYYGTSETSITLKIGEGTKLPTPPFNLVWWNATDYQDPTDDPYREIVRVSAVNGDTLTVSRGQENTSAQPHNISGKLYKMMRALTAKDFDDLQKIDVYKDGNLIGSRPKINFKGGDVSDDSLNNKIDVFLTGNFAARATNPPSLHLYVSKGQVIIGETYVFFSGGNSPSFSIPTNYPRIDWLCLNDSGELEIVQGTESSNPSAPGYPANKFIICEVYNRPNQTAIKDFDDGVNGYIRRDVRPFLVLKKEVIESEASDNVRHINSAAKGTRSYSPVKLKECKLNFDLPACRIKFTLYGYMHFGGGNLTAYARIYKNGSPIGTIRSVAALQSVEFSEDFTGFQKGDLIQVYGWVSEFGVESVVSNLKFCYDAKISKFPGYKIISAVEIINQDP